MIFNISPPEQLDNSVTITNWLGAIYPVTALLEEIITADPNRKKLFLENRSAENIYIKFGDANTELMAIYPDSAWVEEDAASFSVWAEGNGNLYVAQWIV
ncbi:hypothetical protein NIES2119_09960 [[Phormidium ambiguum] IAM M-71]|uniref:Uncharacterized protein n=1 Tax=[Phormidium ambiguum] IAM M-71 TaxID=454136 RepID=A0A1U7IM53_9CYAN|nr:hypothetical protein [Phormidium ambiguum]OKH38352.1 hypothetical protein NIES2119_09960 [Phormidium ambiguum IAM M-71]